MKYRYCFPVNVYQVHVIENKTRNMWAKLGTILQFLFSGEQSGPKTLVYVFSFVVIF